jgi:hypothetical protein
MKDYKRNMERNNMKELEEMLEKLSNSLKEMSEVVEVSQKYPQHKDVYGLVLDKRIEDGLIKNLHNASEEQLKIMKNSFHWKYYKEEEKKIENRINELIVNKKRSKKLERILKDE